jgi:hypothetical protein
MTGIIAVMILYRNKQSEAFWLRLVSVFFTGLINRMLSGHQWDWGFNRLIIPFIWLWV